jgi:ABC-type antimicrobial peptide transport system permease subunit
LAGAAIGLLLMPTVSQVMASLIWGVAGSDFGVLATAAGVLVCTAAVASLVPASRLLRIQPMSLLRAE